MNEIPKQNQRSRRLPSGACLACLVLTLTGCSLLRFHHSPPKAEVTSLQLATNTPGAAVTTGVLQIQVMRFADSYVASVAQAADEFGAKVGTPKARLAALKWKLGQATSAYTDATGPSPVVNALDILVLVTVTRMVAEDYGVETFGDAILPLLETQRQQETNAWSLANGMLKPAQQQELRDLIQEWRQKNPHQRYVGAIRFREFATALGKPQTPATTSPTSVFSLLYLDPLAGLDPTTAAIEETQRLGERAMYYTQRMPQLLSWQTEVLGYQLAAQPESAQVLSNANQLATSAEMFTKTAQQLPQLINDQRQAAIQQLLDGLRSQETDVRQTLNAGGDAAASIGVHQCRHQIARRVRPLCFITEHKQDHRFHQQPAVQRARLRHGCRPDWSRRQGSEHAAHHAEPEHAPNGPTRTADRSRRQPCGGPCVPEGIDFDSGFVGRLGSGGLDLSHSGEQIDR
jgi:hypothetical protein